MTEVWLRGPLPGLEPLLQPVGHALLQSVEDVSALMEDFPEALLWERPGGVASAGFHLQHLRGVVDRLFTYARGEGLTGPQLGALAAEGSPGLPAVSARELVAAYAAQVDLALGQLKEFTARELTDARGVGRAGLPSTVIGLLVHAAEHVQRHTGQLLVTIRVLIPPGGQPASPDQLNCPIDISAFAYIKGGSWKTCLFLHGSRDRAFTGAPNKATP